jgi:hypothetical protein
MAEAPLDYTTAHVFVFVLTGSAIIARTAAPKPYEPKISKTDLSARSQQSSLSISVMLPSRSVLLAGDGECGDGHGESMI